MLNSVYGFNDMIIPTFSFSSETNEHYTPQEVVQAVKSVLGYIDLDAASCEQANRVVGASRYFDIRDNALNQKWIADTVFCNPPYGKDQNKSRAGLFLSKIIDEYNLGHFKSGIILVNACPSSAWFKPAYQFPICFSDGRLCFLDYQLKPLNQPTKDNALIYIGNGIKRFIDVFHGTIGTVMVSV
jgi:hypothetical protein